MAKTTQAAVHSWLGEPLTATMSSMLARLRRQHLRVSTERVHSGPGICEIYEALAARENRPAQPLDDRTIWDRGIAREDGLAAAAFALEHGS